MNVLITAASRMTRYDAALFLPVESLELTPLERAGRAPVSAAPSEAVA
jgi:hypothetical protein